MKYTALVLGFLFLSISAISQNNYDVSLIPKALLTRAGAVIRSDETRIEVKDLDDVYHLRKRAITILNESALEEASIVIYYDKTTSIKSVSGMIYNESGQAISKISEKHFQDRSAVSDISLFADDRVKIFRPSKLSFPFTIEYEYETRTRQSFILPSWVPAAEPGIAVESSVLTFIGPESFILRYKDLNYNGTVDETLKDGIKTLTWRVSNIKALREEPYSPHYEDYSTTLKLAPEKFAYKNLKGAFSNWQEFGQWVTDNLLKGKGDISEVTKGHITELIKDTPDPKERAKKIYTYMQEKTRYISVQIGIGGYQPYPAMEVDRLGYGDCKGLVNYMQALLKTAGIESYYTLVWAGRAKRDIRADFTSQQGNHAILCIPFKNDTTWLECTSKDAPFGFLGDFTDDRNVLACTPQGGKIMRTPKLSAMDNKQIRNATFKISSDGVLSGTMTTSFSGSQYDNHHSLLNEPYTEQVKKLPELYPMPNLEIQSLSFTQKKDKTPETREIVNLSSHNYSILNEGKLSIKMNGVNQMRPLKEIRNRINPVQISRGYYDEDNITYLLPEDYIADLPPKSTLIETKFGKYSAEVKVSGKTITYKRRMLLNEGNYSAEQYQELVDFFQSISDADNLVAVLRKK